MTTTAQRRVLDSRCRSSALDAHLQHVRGKRRRQTASAIFAVDLERRGPEPRSVADRDGAERIDDDECRDLHAIAGLSGGRADAAFQVCGQGAEPRAGAAERKAGCGCRRRGVTEIAVGRKAAPLLVAAIEKVEADRAGHDRNNGAANLEASAPFGKPGLHAAAGFQPERRTAGQHDRVDPLHGVGEVEQRAFAGSGPSAAHIQRCNNLPVEDDRRDAGSEVWVASVSDANACNVGEQIVHRDTQLFSASRIMRARSDFRYGLASSRTPVSRRPW